MYKYRRVNKENPSLLVATFPTGASVDTNIHDGQVNLVFFTDPLDGGYNDDARQGLIMDRLVTLFNDVDLTRSGYLIYYSHVISTGIGQIDLANPEEHYGFVRIDFMTAKQ